MVLLQPQRCYYHPMSLSCVSTSLSAYLSHHYKKEIEPRIAADVVFDLFMYWKFVVCLEICTSHSAAYYSNRLIIDDFLFLFLCQTIACRSPHEPVAHLSKWCARGIIYSPKGAEGSSPSRPHLHLTCRCRSSGLSCTTALVHAIVVLLILLLHIFIPRRAFA